MGLLIVTRFHRVEKDGIRYIAINVWVEEHTLMIDMETFHLNKSIVKHVSKGKWIQQ